MHERLAATMIYVTHDQVEAMTLADKIVVLRDGRIEQVGSPLDLYERPQNALVHLTTENGTEFIAKMEHAPTSGKGSILSFDVQDDLMHYFNKETGQRKSNA